MRMICKKKTRWSSFLSFSIVFSTVSWSFFMDFLMFVAAYYRVCSVLITRNGGFLLRLLVLVNIESVPAACPGSELPFISMPHGA